MEVVVDEAEADQSGAGDAGEAMEGIDFAFPSQSVYLANDEKRQLALRMLNEERGTD